MDSSETPKHNDMLDLHRHFGTRRVWERIEVPKSPTIDVTEIWCHDVSDAPAVESRNISALHLENWLQEPSTKYIHSEDHTRVFRIVWVGVAPTGTRYSPSDRDLQRLLSAWGLQDGYDYALSCFAGVSALPSLDGSRTRIFTAAYHPKLALTWSHTTPDTTKHTSTSLLASAATEGKHSTNMVIFAQGEERRNLLASLKSTWSLSLITDPMFPALLSSLVLAQDLDSTLEDIKTVVRNVEARTGHHRFSTRRQTRPAAGELGSLSAEMSGCAAKLANGTRKLKVIEALNSFLADHDPSSASSKPEPIMKSHSSLLSHRAQMQEIDITCTHQRVQIQIGALLHLIAQQDNAIAFETANATRSIAKDSLQDASSMKMLALVAMFFLPGSFVAALFSAPVFDWDSSAGTSAGTGTAVGGLGVPTKPGFKLFWAIAVPLTVVTFGLYGMWICLQKKRMRRRLNAGFA